MAAPEPSPADGSKPLSGLLSGIAQAAYHGKAGITEELLRGQLYPEAAPEEFRVLRAKMGGLLQWKTPLSEAIRQRHDVSCFLLFGWQGDGEGKVTLA